MKRENGSNGGSRNSMNLAGDSVCFNKKVYFTVI